MTAEEARKITEEAKLVNLEEIFNLIKERASDCCNYLYLSYELDHSLVMQLKSLGYQVDYGSIAGIQVSWHHKITW